LKRLKHALLLLIPLAVWLASGQAFAHSSLVKAVPAPDSRLDQPPAQIELTFNERLERELYDIRVFDRNGRSVADGKAKMSEDRREIRLPLPKLADGIYTVSYKILSADGHPVSGSYVITVGAPPERPTANPEQAGHVHADHGGQGQIEYWAIRIVYYAALLFLIGWTAWSVILRKEPEEVRKLHRYWSRHLLWLFLILHAGVGLMQFGDLLADLKPHDLWTLFVKTSAGLSWLLSLLIAAAGLPFVQRARSFDALWAAALVVCKSFSGHAAAFDPPMMTVALDALHLTAASLWAGGLFYLVVIGIRFPERRAAFIALFSRTALISIAALALTGSLSTLLFMPRLKYLLYTAWGWLLIAKTALVALAIATAAVIRLRMRKRRNAPPQRIIHIEFALMLCIVGIVGVFTFLNPLPVNKPLHWHEMGQNIHMTAEISPNSPGENDFAVSVWLPERMKEPKRVLMYLQNQDRRDIGPIEVPLAPDTRGRPYPETFTGFNRYDYAAQGPYLPFPGHWKIELRIMDPEDNETVYTKEINIY
jgi:copper transport protein